MRFFQKVSGIKFIVLAALLALAGGIVWAQDAECAFGGYPTEENGGCTYSITVNISYPPSVSEYPAAAAAVDELLTLTRDSFFADMGDMYGPYFGGGALDIFYEEYEHGAALRSIVFTVYAFTGGAHGNTYFSSITVDTIADIELALDGDIFLPDTDFVSVLQPLVVAQLAETMGEYADMDWINDGTDEADDYIAWAINAGTLELFFAPYQVAPYAMGTFQVSIPVEDLYPVINPMLIP